jgi:hypothetical protein
LLSLLAALFGGAAVSLVAYMGNRGKTRAEIAKLDAETDRVRAETAALGRGGRSTGEYATRLSDRILGWGLTGSQPDDYEVTLDRTIAYIGNTSALLEAQPEARGFATLMQTFDSATMRGKRIRMSAFVRTQDVARAALWMRVNGTEDAALAFDNMDDRPIAGTSGWLRYDIVLDVDMQSQAIAFGVILAGRGRVWVDNFTFESVGSEVATTELPLVISPLPKPENLDFEDCPQSH